MKFGKNLTHLSIPEWKDYNLDYNELKKHIRHATQTPQPDLRSLKRIFNENFDYLDLFIMTKLGELSRKLKSDAREFARITASNEPAVVQLEYLDSLHYKLINEVSIELRKLNKFILVQKIAVKKIFKKFSKHYPDEAESKVFIASLMKTLHTNRALFMNFDSSQLTSNLLYLLLDIDRELKLLHESLQRKPHMSGREKLKKNHLSSTVASARNSVFLSPLLPEDVNLDANFELDISKTARFDIVTALKKNFAVHSLIPRDVASRNDIDLSMDVYLNIPKIAETFRVSYIKLIANADDETPSCIISYEDSPVSTVIAYTGGLRKYSYCCLPNTVVNSILAFLTSEDAVRKEREFEYVTNYLEDKSLSSMTKSAVSYLLKSDLSPSLRFVMERTRYFLHKGGNKEAPKAQAGQSGQSDKLSISPLSAGLGSTAPSLDDNKVYEDSFYMTLDEQIYTSGKLTDEISFDVDSMDPFPFNTFSIHSNDSNLHNFEASLTTEIQGNMLQNKFRAITLKKLPVKIQNLLRTTSVQIFKDFCLFDYMRSCYFNVIPAQPNNHYSRLLNINLFKSYEDIDALNSQHDVDGSIIQDKSRVILNRQMSYKSLRDIEETPDQEYSQKLASKQMPSLPERSDPSNQENPYNGSGGDIFGKLGDLENYNEEGNEDTYIAYLDLNTDLEHNPLNLVILSFIRLKYRFKKLLGVSDHPSEADEHTYFGAELRSRDLYYDSINEDATYLDKTNDYETRLTKDYDDILSFIYFSLCFSSIFILGINIGILYSVFSMLGKGTNFNISDNFLVMALLFFGFLFSLLFSMTSINLSFQRFEPSPPSHSGIIWAGFVLVLLTVTWSLVCVFP